MPRFSALLALVLVLTRAVVAQSSWTAIPSSTNETLWGVCFGDAQFVAVGENGTILTSPDGRSWTSRASGTQRSLRSVAYGIGRYVAVGDESTIVVSQDAITWQPVSLSPGARLARLNTVKFHYGSFVAHGEYDTTIVLQLPFRGGSISILTQRENGASWRSFAFGRNRYVFGGETGLTVGNNIALPGASLPVTVPAGLHQVGGLLFENDRFVAVASGGLALTSTDASLWTTQPTGTTADLHDVASFNGTLIAVGAAGTILTSNEITPWVLRPALTAATLYAVAGNDSTAVIVGVSGTILRSAADSIPPVITTQPASVTETTGGVAAFVMRAIGTAPLRYQWSRNGTALPGETRSALQRAPLRADDAGNYSVAVSNGAGSVVSSPASLTVLPASPPIVDPGFTADSSLEAPPTALLPLADGGVLVAVGNPGRVLKLRPDGSPDPSWRLVTFRGPPANALPLNAPAMLAVLALQADGRVLVGGSFTSVDGAPRARLIRLTTVGEFDPTFTPSTDATARSAYAIAVEASGRILLANYGNRVLALFPDGSEDPSWNGRLFSDRSYSARDVAVGPGGEIFAGGEHNLTVAPGGRSRADGAVFRLRSDGTVDPTFMISAPDGLVALRPLANGHVIVAVQVITVQPAPAPPIASYSAHLLRFDAEGRPVPGYRSQTFYYRYPLYLYPDGRVLWLGPNLSPIRLLGDGAIDPTFTGGVGFPTLLAAGPNEDVFVSGPFNIYNGTPANRLARLNSVAQEAERAPQIIRFVADKTVVRYGEPITIQAYVTGSGPLTYDWTGPRSLYLNIADTSLRTTSSTLTFQFRERGDTTVSLRVRNSRGESSFESIVFTLLAADPEITVHSPRISAQTGRDVRFFNEVNATADAVEYEWRHEGRLLTSSTRTEIVGASLFLRNVTAADAGSYTLTVRNRFDVATTVSLVLTVDDTSRLVNLSTRAMIRADEPGAIAGFAISGNTGRRVLLRGIGPSLAKFGVRDPLPDPQIEVFNSNGQPRTLANNDDWDANATVDGIRMPALFERVGAFPLEAGSKDAAFVAILDPGTYTVRLNGKPGQSGPALLEVYECDNDAMRLMNISTRTVVGPAESAAIAGFSVQGPVPKRLLVRAVGPALDAFGVNSPLPDPRLELKDAIGTILATNDDWSTAANASELSPAAVTVGAFPFATASRDAALLLTLAPGTYTAHLTSADTTSGSALIEIYDVPDSR